MKISLPLSAVISLIFFLASELIAVNFFKKPELAPVLKNASPAIFATSGFIIISFGLQGLQKTKASIFILNIGTPFLAGLGLLFFNIKTAESAALLYTVATFIVLLTGSVLWTSSGNKQSSGSILFSTLSQSFLPLWVVVIVKEVIQVGASLLAGPYVSAVELANFVIAQRTSMLMAFLLLALNTVVAPQFSAMYGKKDFQSIRNLAARSSRLLFITSAPVFAFLILFPDWILSLFGVNFSEGENLLRILSLGQFISVIIGPVGIILSMTGNEKIVRNNAIFSSILLILLSFLLIPSHGIIGAAIATSLSVSAQNLLCALNLKKILTKNLPSNSVDKDIPII